MTTRFQWPMLAAMSPACLFALFCLLSCASNPNTPSREVQASRTRHSGLLHEIGRELNIVQNFIPPGNLNRRQPTRMSPRYITIHSTANVSATADAEAHAKLLHRAGRGRLSWHYTVDEKSIYQTLPNTEQGRHADYDGPGNRYSIGIEMCENQGNSLDKTLDNTARLTAKLMHQYDIPISKVVPHYHWPRVKADGKDYGQKACPQILMDNGKPGVKWRAFTERVKSYHRQSSK